MYVRKIVPFEYRASGLLFGRVSNQVRDILYSAELRAWSVQLEGHGPNSRLAFTIVSD